eukprot:17270-Heterococcus_DN1.PRE.1
MLLYAVPAALYAASHAVLERDDHYVHGQCNAQYKLSEFTKWLVRSHCFKKCAGRPHCQHCCWHDVRAMLGGLLGPTDDLITNEG